MKKLLLGTLIYFFCNALQAQMWNGQDTLYGNEWINYENADRYYKILVEEDGIYRISFETLQQSISNLENITGSQLQLFHFGEEVPIFVSTNESLTTGDYLEFFAEIDLLGALSACPGGNCSTSHSSQEAQCFPLKVAIYKSEMDYAGQWHPPKPNGYNRGHGVILGS